MTDFHEPFAHAPRPHTLALTDDELLILINAGTTGAFTTFYVRHASDVQSRVAERFDYLARHQAQHVTASAFLVVLKVLIAGTEKLAAGDVLDLVDRVAGEVATGESCVEDDDAYLVADQGWGHSTSHVGNTQNLAEAFASLPNHWQRILWLKHVEGLPVARVASQLGNETRQVERLARRATRELSQRRRSRVGHEGRRTPGGLSLAEQARSTSLSGRADVMRANLGTGLIHIVLSSPTLLEQHVDLITGGPTLGTSAGANMTATASTPTHKEEPAGDEREDHTVQASHVRLDSATAGRTRRGVPGPALVAVSIAGAALCTCVIGLIFSPWNTSQAPMSPAGTPIGESSSSSESSHIEKRGTGADSSTGNESGATPSDDATTNHQEPAEEHASEKNSRGSATAPPTDASTPSQSHPDRPASTSTSEPSHPVSTSPADPDPTLSDGPAPSAPESPAPPETPSAPTTQDPKPTDPPDDTGNPQSPSADANDDSE